MIVVNLKGGLGNQMFQYAFGMTLAHKYGVNLALDCRALSGTAPRGGAVSREFNLDIFSIPEIQAQPRDLPGVGLGIGSRRYRSLWLQIRRHFPHRTRVLIEKGFAFDQSALECGGSAYVDGYWQSEQYFQEIQALIRKRFVVTTPHLPEAEALMKRISSINSVCLHVRRTDFVNNPLHDTLDTNYFERAVRELKNHIGNEFDVFIFSDDLQWCAENLRIWHKQTLVPESFVGSKCSTYFALMSSCRHFVIPNSTFSWWAAWLARNAEKVIIGPKRWFGDPAVDTSDVLPKTWIRV